MKPTYGKGRTVGRASHWKKHPLLIMRDGEVSKPYAKPEGLKDDASRSVAKARRQKNTAG
jgi:hypothetical protein